MRESVVVNERPAETTEASRDLPALGEENEGERVSVTDVHGSVARFDMSYPAQDGPTLFGPPLRQRLPSFLYLAIAIIAAVVIFVAPTMSRGSFLFMWVVEGDRGRPLSAAALSLILVASAIGTVIRAHMRGVVVKREGIEARYLLTLGFPRIKKWNWAQIHRMVLDDEHIMLELWDNAYARLPEVGDTKALSRLLEQIGAARSIQVTRLKPVGG